MNSLKRIGMLQQGVKVSCIASPGKKGCHWLVNCLGIPVLGAPGPLVAVQGATHLQHQRLTLLTGNKDTS